MMPTWLDDNPEVSMYLTLNTQIDFWSEDMVIDIVTLMGNLLNNFPWYIQILFNQTITSNRFGVYRLYAGMWLRRNHM